MRLDESEIVVVILPDGRLDPSGARFVGDDVPPEPIEISPLVADAIEDGCKTPEQIDHYLACIKNGCARGLARVLALKSPPGFKTDAIFNEGKFSGQSTGECEARGRWLRHYAESRGVSTTGKWYCSGLASFPGDPTAWVGGRGDVLRVAREKNLNVHGYVEHKARETDPGGDVRIADDLIDGEVADVLEAHPGADADAVREQVVALRTGAVDPNPLRCLDYTSTEIP